LRRLKVRKAEVTSIWTQQRQLAPFLLLEGRKEYSHIYEKQETA
jgi:hypothetical protein